MIVDLFSNPGSGRLLKHGVSVTLDHLSQSGDYFNDILYLI